jgi:type II secretion system protein G
MQVLNPPEAPLQAPPRQRRWRAYVAGVATGVFVLLYTFVHPLCACPLYYLELSAIGIVPLLVGPRPYRFLGAAILVTGLLSSEADRRGAIRERQLARTIRVTADLHMFGPVLESYKEANGAYPSTEQGLAALVVEPSSSPIPSHRTQLLWKVPKDPWQNDYVYRQPGRAHAEYDLFSPGPDHIADTADDNRGN